MKAKIEALIKHLEDTNDFDGEFYQAFITGDDLSDWHYNHFEDNLGTGYDFGRTAHAEEMINKLKEILKGE